jgi:Bacterial protein of unknown function (DUF899)
MVVAVRVRVGGKVSLFEHDPRCKPLGDEVDRQAVRLRRAERRGHAGGALRDAESVDRLPLHVSPEWDEGCPHCSFWADNFNGIGIYLNHRDVSLVNFDYQASFTPGQASSGTAFFNYAAVNPGPLDREGVSASHCAQR